MAKEQKFISDIEAIRRRAREHIKQGAITPGYQIDRATAVRVLNEALATEIVCTLRYKNHYVMAEGINSESVAEEFLQHAREEEDHADRLAIRIKQIGGEPDMDPDTLTARSHAEYQRGETLVQMIEEDLIAERIAIDSYREMIHFFGDKDSTSRRLIEDILAKEEEHADELSSLLVSLDPTKKPSHAA